MARKAKKAKKSSKARKATKAAKRKPARKKAAAKKAARKTAAPAAAAPAGMKAAFKPPHKCQEVMGGCLMFFPDDSGDYTLPLGGRPVDCSECKYWF